MLAVAEAPALVGVCGGSEPALSGERRSAESEGCARAGVSRLFCTIVRLRLPEVAASTFDGEVMSSCARARSPNVEAVEANETWLAFQRDRSPPRMDSIGDVGRSCACGDLGGRPARARTALLGLCSSPDNSLKSGPVVSSPSSSSAVVPVYSLQLEAREKVGERGLGETSRDVRRAALPMNWRLNRRRCPRSVSVDFALTVDAKLECLERGCAEGSEARAGSRDASESARAPCAGSVARTAALAGTSLRRKLHRLLPVDDHPATSGVAMATSVPSPSESVGASSSPAVKEARLSSVKLGAAELGPDSVV